MSPAQNNTFSSMHSTIFRADTQDADPLRLDLQRFWEVETQGFGTKGACVRSACQIIGVWETIVE